MGWVMDLGECKTSELSDNALDQDRECVVGLDWTGIAVEDDMNDVRYGILGEMVRVLCDGSAVDMNLKPRGEKASVKRRSFPSDNTDESYGTKYISSAFLLPIFLSHSRNRKIDICQHKFKSPRSSFH